MKQNHTRALRDIDIRVPLDRSLRDAHLGDQTTTYIHELKMPRPSARIDIALVNGELGGYEIKSDVDSLARLDRQQKAFSAIFDRMHVVTTDRYIDNTINSLPAWWGVIRVGPQSNSVSFSQVRPAKINPCVNLISVAHLLDCKEIRDCLSDVIPSKQLRLVRRAFLVDAMLESFSEGNLKYRVREALKSRVKTGPHNLREPLVYN